MGAVLTGASASSNDFLDFFIGCEVLFWLRTGIRTAGFDTGPVGMAEGFEFAKVTDGGGVGNGADNIDALLLGFTRPKYHVELI